MTHLYKKLLFVTIALFSLSLSSFAVLADIENIQIDIVSAPVVPNGIVASEPTEFNAILRRDGVSADDAMDPQEFGIQIPAGGRMEVELAGSFIPNTDLLGFFPGRNIIITTGPQNPVKPNTEAVSGGNWRIETPDAKTVSIIPKGGSGANGLEGTRAGAIGFKVIHIRPDAGNSGNPSNRSHSGTPFYNGPAGSVGTLNIRIFDSENTLVATGTENIIFPAEVGRQVNISNITTRDDNSINSNTNFQRVIKNTKLTETSLPPSGIFTDGGPYAAQFLLFDNFGSHDPDQYPTGATLPEKDGASFIPFPGIANLTVQNTRHNNIALLLDDDVVIGMIVMKGPSHTQHGKHNKGFRLMRGKATVTQIGNGTLLYIPAKVGNAKGAYTVTVKMLNGGEATHTIVVE